MKFQYKKMLGSFLFMELSENKQIQNLADRISPDSAMQFLNAVLHNQAPRISVTIDYQTGEIIDGYKRLSALSMIFLSDDERPFRLAVKYREDIDMFRYTGYKPNEVFNKFSMRQICDRIKTDRNIPTDVNINDWISNLKHCNIFFRNLIIDVCCVIFETEEEKQILRNNINAKLAAKLSQ